ncbi:MAG: DUF86 domain-containing protein [Methanosarcinales archaeon]
MKNYIEYLKHILQETEFLRSKSKDITFEEFIQDEVLMRAFVRSLEIIGEAVKNIHKDVIDKYGDIEWKKIAGMRDKLIHEYFGVDYYLVWDVVKRKIPYLDKRIREIIEEERK